MRNLNFEMVLEAAKKAIGENVNCYSKENMIGVAEWVLPPGHHKISERITISWIEIMLKKKTCTIEVGGWDGAKPPAVWKLKNQQICEGRADDFLVKMFEKYDINLRTSVNRMLDPYHLSKEEKISAGLAW